MLSVNALLWIKSFHIIFMVTWFAGLFYLPRLYVYHTLSDDSVSHERFKVMERKLFYGIMTPGAILTIILGVLLIPSVGMGGWLHAKISLVLALVIYHAYCGKLLIDFKHDRNKHGHVFYRWLNEMPVLALIAIVILVEVKPF